MDYKTFISLLSEKLDRDSKDIEFLAESLCDIIVERVKDGDSVSIPGFGQFEPKLKSERIASHPSSGKKILVPPKISLLFKPSALLKQRVKNA